MKSENNLKAIFFDVGGVCLTNGWNETSREKLAQEFHLNFKETEKIHNTLFEDFNRRDITLEHYIDSVYLSQEQKNDLSIQDIIGFMKDQSISFNSSLEILEKLKKNGSYRLDTINNGSFFLNQFRVEKFDRSRPILR